MTPLGWFALLLGSVWVAALLVGWLCITSSSGAPRPRDCRHRLPWGTCRECTEEQRRSFAHGNGVLDNPEITRAMVDEAAERIAVEDREIEQRLNAREYAQATSKAPWCAHGRRWEDDCEPCDAEWRER